MPVVILFSFLALIVFMHTCMLSWVFLTNSVTCCSPIQVCVCHVFKVHCFLFFFGPFYSAILVFGGLLTEWKPVVIMDSLAPRLCLFSWFSVVFSPLRMFPDSVLQVCFQDFKSPHMISESTDSTYWVVLGNRESVE